MTEKELYDMPLHHSVKLDAYIITRVVGGWIYVHCCCGSMSAVFVPETLCPMS